MPVVGVDHVNIRTTDIAASIKFYEDAFGFEYRLGPLVMGNQGHWLFDGAGRAIIHLRELAPTADSTGPIDHVALSCRNKQEILERLGKHGIEYSMVENLTPGVAAQVFVKDVHGVPLELTFPAE